MAEPLKKPNLPWDPSARRARCSYLEEQYPAWVRANRLRSSDIRRMREEAAGFGYEPVISLLLPVGDVEPSLLERTLDSMLAQVYGRWELRVLNASGERARDVLSRYERLDERMKPLEHGVSSATLPEDDGDFLGILEAGDELAPDALFEVAKLLQKHPDADLVYTDSDRIDGAGNRSSPNFKPGWSPDLLLGTDYVSGLAIYRREILDRIDDLDMQNLHDLALRFTEKTARVHHLPKVLCHESGDGDRGTETSARAISSALERRGMEARIEEGPVSGVFEVVPDVKGEPEVSVVIPTRDNVHLLRNCIESVEALTAYRNYEILIVDNESVDPATVEYLSSTPHRVLRFEEEFNYSRINNFAVAHAEGEYVLLLNDDTEVISAGWMDAMLGHAQRPEIGAVGAKLLYPDGRVQHAGVVLGAGNFWAPGVAAHSCQHYPADATGHAGTVINTTREYGAVTAACMMLRKSVFEEVGGFDEEHLPVAFNDVDLCLKIRERGYRVLYTPHAELYHYESSSRGPQRRPDENLYMRKRWGAELDEDPYYNPNFSLGAGDFNLRADALRPKILRRGEVKPAKHLEEMDGEEKNAYLEAARRRSRDSRRTTIVAREPALPLAADIFEDAAAGPVRAGGERIPIKEEQLIWMFGSPRTGSTWISGVMEEMDNQRRWNEPHVGLLFGSFFYEKIDPGSSLHESPAFIMGEPYRKAWLRSVKHFVLEGATARYPGLRKDQYVVIKEPNGSLGAPLIMEAMPESRLLFLLRDPRDVVSSWVDAFKQGSWTAVNCEYDTDEKLNAHTRFLAERYLKVVSQVQRAYEAHAGKKAFVRYEDLRRDTFGTMEAMYRALGIEVDESRLQAAVEKHNWESIPESRKGSGKFYRKATPGGWREDLSPAQIQIVEEVTATVLSKFYKPGA